MLRILTIIRFGFIRPQKHMIWESSIMYRQRRSVITNQVIVYCLGWLVLSLIGFRAFG